MARTREELEALFNARDVAGNKMSLNSKNVVLYQPIGPDSRARGLGSIVEDDKGRIICTKEEDESQIFRKDNSWSVNRMLLDRVDVIIYQTKVKKYTITRERALMHGTFRTYLNEEKCYIPLTQWKDSYNSTIQEKRSELMGMDWATRLNNHMNSDSFKQLSMFVASERQRVEVYPEPKDVFKALKLTPYENVKVVIIGQDPYYNGVADGLAFSTKETMKVPTTVPASLSYIIRELEANDLKPRIMQHDLTPWAEQGVLLLNSILTVEHDKPRSHAGKGWEEFTRLIISMVNQSAKPTVFILWGNDAKEYKNLLDTKYHLVLEGAHPAAESRGYGGFLGGNYFTKANDFLRENGRGEINW